MMMTTAALGIDESVFLYWGSGERKKVLSSYEYGETNQIYSFFQNYHV